MKLHIGISGIIGAGKTTMAASVGEVLGSPIYYEPVIDNEYLADFYSNMERYAFNMQIYLLNKRFKQQQKLIWSDEGGVQDRTIYEDSIFARMLYESGMMDKRDYDTYTELFNNMSNFMKKPDIIVHLDITPEESLWRIKQRGRECEKNVTIEYLISLKNAYDLFLSEISSHIRVIRIDWNDRNPNIELTAQIIKQKCESMKSIETVHLY